MKKLMFIIASLFFATSIVSANPSKQVDFNTMNKTDSQFLFDGATKAIALSGQEMLETEGEWGWFIPIFLGWGTAVANAPTTGGPTYSGSIMTYWW